MNYKPIIVIEGDPEGVFLELFFKVTKYNSFKSDIILICSKKNLKKQMIKCKFKKKINLLNPADFKKFKLKKNTINLIDVKFKNSNLKKLRNKFIKNYINDCFEMSFRLIKENFTYKLINGPIEKKIFLKKKFPGVTEYISKKFNQKKTGMLIYNKKLSVCPLTTHIPVKNISKMITKKLIMEKIILINNFYEKTFKISPKIAITGLNPHCESILDFNEDIKIIKPAIQEMKRRNIGVSGPFPADTIFISKNRKYFDVIIGMYHDQVLTPIKALYEFDAINITMGLPFLRVTPDHGPNKKMEGKNISNPKSLIRALEFLDKR